LTPKSVGCPLVASICFPAIFYRYKNKSKTICYTLTIYMRIKGAATASQAKIKAISPFSERVFEAD
jgi:hypothetical protein